MALDVPPVFVLLSWHPYRQRALPIDAGEVLGKLAGANGGVPPEELATEPLLRLFADCAGIRLVDEDLEDVTVWPNDAFASRPWTRAAYQRFVAWCREVGWLERNAGTRATPAAGSYPPVAPPDPPKTPEGKRKRQPVAA